MKTQKITPPAIPYHLLKQGNFATMWIDGRGQVMRVDGFHNGKPYELGGYLGRRMIERAEFSGGFERFKDAAQTARILEIVAYGQAIETGEKVA